LIAVAMPETIGISWVAPDGSVILRGPVSNSTLISSTHLAGMKSHIPTIVPLSLTSQASQVSAPGLGGSIAMLLGGGIGGAAIAAIERKKDTPIVAPSIAPP
jgi:hypothetical protein